MSDDKLHIIYTAEDIEQYFSGKLLPAQMHALEKAALDDPFLAEAMEGFSAMKKDTWEKELMEARAAIENKQTQKKAVPVIVAFKWWKAVAAVLIIGGGAGVLYQLNNASTQHKNESIAAVKKTGGDTVNSVAGNNTVQQPAVSPEANKNNDNTLIATVKTKAQYDSTIAYEPPKRNRVQVLRNESVAYEAEQENSNSKKNTMTPAAPVTLNNNAEQVAFAKESDKAANSNDMLSDNKKLPAMNRVFEAEVIGPDNTPLPFAKINIPAENVGTYADVNGKFRLVAVDSTLNIEVRAAGFTSRSFNMTSNVTKNTIVLNETPFATKDIVQFKNKARKSNAESRKVMQVDTILNVEPVDGWSNYNTYLNNNITPPVEVLQKNIHGEVEVSFDVQKDGKISNVNVAKSLCGNCDEEAIRAIKEGPQWKVKKGKKEKARVKIKF